MEEKERVVELPKGSEGEGASDAWFWAGYLEDEEDVPEFVREALEEK